MGGRETPEQQRARKQRRVQRLYGGDWGHASRERRKRECEIAGRPYRSRGTVDDIAKRAAIKKLIRLLRYIVHCRPCTDPVLLAQRIERKRNWMRVYSKRRYRDDPKYVIYHRVKRNIKKHMRDGKASRNWSQRLGYTMAELRTHLQRQFTDGMTWENMGSWHIDHIRPVASFSFTCVDEPQFRECYALSNLRPLWGRDNIIKHAKRMYLL
jgi:hypothetical protein